jgi:hypothetical protein
MIRGHHEAPAWYTDWGSTTDCEVVEHGGLGIRLFLSDELPRGQTGFAVTHDGKSLVGSGPGDWRSTWIVIGHDTGCGDPIFVSHEPPHPVFSAMHGQGAWEPRSVAPSLDRFKQCLEAFRLFTAGRTTAAEGAEL